MSPVLDVSKPQRLAPILPVRDVDVALRRFESMGWKTQIYDGAIYGFVDTGGGEFHVALVRELDPFQTTSAVYVYVADADALFERWKEAEIPGSLRPPCDTEYGLREFAYIDPDGNLFRVGSPL